MINSYVSINTVFIFHVYVLDDPGMRLCKKRNIFPFIDCPFKQLFIIKQIVIEKL